VVADLVYREGDLFINLHKIRFFKAFLLIVWSGWIGKVRLFFPSRARKDRMPRGFDGMAALGAVAL
jgi:hypothetical protein